MLVFWDAKLVFLAVPKTGTTALEGALAPRASMVLRDPPILKHCPAYRYQKLVEPFLKKAGDVELETLAVVRNPIDWLGSWYRYRYRDDLVGHPNSTRGISFDTFVEHYAEGNSKPYAAVGSQAKFVLKDDGNSNVSHLFKYEAQDLLRRFLEDRLSVSFEPKRLNVSPQIELNLSSSAESKLKHSCENEFHAWELAQG